MAIGIEFAVGLTRDSVPRMDADANSTNADAAIADRASDGSWNSRSEIRFLQPRDQIPGWRIDPEFHLLRKMPGINLAVDVGGNWGQSILALQHVCNPQKIISFEPNPVLAQRLTKKFASEESVSILNQAVSEAPGTLKLYIPSYNGYIFDGLASLDYESAHGWLNSERLSIDAVEVSSVNLDSFELSPDVLKVDVQGLEYQVLRGGVDTLRRSHPVTIIEAPTPEVTSFMAEVGMEPFSVIEGKIEKGLHDTVNTVFLSRDKQLVLADEIS